MGMLPMGRSEAGGAESAAGLLRASVELADTAMDEGCVYDDQFLDNSQIR